MMIMTLERIQEERIRREAARLLPCQGEDARQYLDWYLAKTRTWRHEQNGPDMREVAHFAALLYGLSNTFAYASFACGAVKEEAFGEIVKDKIRSVAFDIGKKLAEEELAPSWTSHLNPFFRQTIWLTRVPFDRFREFDRIVYNHQQQLAPRLEELYAQYIALERV